MMNLEVDTPHGPAHVHLHSADEREAALVLGHGAGGGVGARDLVAAKDAALSDGISVALVEQPYLVAGRRSPAPARQLEAAWTAVVEQLREGELRGLPLVVGGRSLGARVACRTVEASGAVAVLCLAFPLQPAGARCGAGADAGRPGSPGSLRRPARRAEPQRGGGGRGPQPANRPRRGGVGGASMAAWRCGIAVADMT
jgi:uncharacterized protein